MHIAKTPTTCLPFTTNFMSGCTSCDREGGSLHPYFSMCSLQTSNISIIRRLVRDAESRLNPRPTKPESACYLSSYSSAHDSLRRTKLYLFSESRISSPPTFSKVTPSPPSLVPPLSCAFRFFPTAPYSLPLNSIRSPLSL